jgi:hypothetical protein
MKLFQCFHIQQIIKIIPKQIHIQLKKYKINKKTNKGRRNEKEIAPLVKWSLRLPSRF